MSEQSKKNKRKTRISRNNKTYKQDKNEINLVPVIHLEPDFIMNNFENIYLFKRRFISMIATGLNPKTFLQKKFQVDYYKFLFERAIKFLTNDTKPCYNKFKSKLQDTNLVKIFEDTKTNELFKYAIKNTLEKVIVDLKKCPVDLNSDNLLNTLNVIEKTLVDIELTLPMYHFYIGILGYSHSLGKEKSLITTDINKLLMLHSLTGSEIIDTRQVEKKTFERAETFVNAILKSIEKNGTDLSKFNINDIINLKKSTSEILAQPFPNSDGTYNNNFYFVTEGNGRLAAIRIAIYKIKQKYPSFVSPKITFECSKLSTKNGVRNQHLLLLSIWLNTFPNLENPDGFTHQLNIERLHPASETLKKNIDSNIDFAFLNGFVPQTYETLDIKLESRNTL
jgi:hypothetical protein